MIEADILLTSLLQSTDEDERERLLEQLITVYAAPIINLIVQRRFVQRRYQFTDHHFADPEDVQREVILELIGRLRLLMTSDRQTPIRSFRRYVIGVAVNVSNDALRTKSPARSNLRDNIREILARNQMFMLRKNGDGKWLCGLAEWCERDTAPDLAVIRGEIEEAARRFIDGRQEGARKIRILGANFIGHLLSQINQPIRLDDLVEIVSSLLNIRDHKIESLDQNEMLSERIAVKNAGPDAELLGRELLHRFWEELRRLPKPQRDVISLGFFDGKGEDLFSLLIGEGIVTPEQIRREFDLPEEEFHTLWIQLPIRDNAVLAERLGATRDQLRKWRYLGWKRIRSVFK
jgi:DNA-directed RNA polymerase specialized sigma24 family protein